MKPGRTAGPVKRWATLAAIGVYWLAVQGLWLRADARILDGDELTNRGMVELFAQDGPRGWWGRLLDAFTGDFGEYPPLFAGVLGLIGRVAGVRDFDGDGPAWLALGVGVLTLALTARLARRLGGTGWLAAALLLGSPLWSALQRHVMLENGLTAWITAAVLAAVAGRWGLCGLAFGAALLTKQTAVLWLPVLGALAWGRMGGGGKPWGLARMVAGVAVAAPWYLGRLGAEGGYLLRSAGANPDAAGPLMQLFYYPLVLGQLAWAPVLWAAALAAWGRWATSGGEDGRTRRLLLGTAITLLLLVLLPKKYPRLLLPLLPILAAMAAAAAERLPRRVRGALAALALLSFTASALGPAWLAPLRPSHLGLGPLDERCPQDWVERPAPPPLDWDALLQPLLSSDEGEERVGAYAWPAPPCALQTTLHLGEHLRIRMRRAGSEAWIDTQDWQQTQSWPDGAPTLLVTDGPLDCVAHPGLCPGRPVPIAAVAGAASWPLDLRIHRFEVAP